MLNIFFGLFEGSNPGLNDVLSREWSYSETTGIWLNELPVTKQVVVRALVFHLLLHDFVQHVYLAGVLTNRIKWHLLGSQLTARVSIIAEVDLSKRPAPQQFPLSPVDWRPRCCRNRKICTIKNSAVIHVLTELSRETGRQSICDIVMWANTNSTTRPCTASHRETSLGPDLKCTTVGLSNPHHRPCQRGKPLIYESNRDSEKSCQTRERSSQQLSSPQSQTLRLCFGINGLLSGHRLRQFRCVWVRGTQGAERQTTDCQAELLVSWQRQFLGQQRTHTLTERGVEWLLSLDDKRGILSLTNAHICEQS